MTGFRTARRVLVYRLGSLGDTVVALPCLHLIARTFPLARRVMLTNFPVTGTAATAASVIGDSGLINGYMRYAMGTRRPFELAGLWWRILRFRPQVLVYLMPLRNRRAVKRDTLFFRAAGIRTIIGLPDQSNSLHILDGNTGLFESEASRLARTISVLGPANPQNLENWDLRLTNAEKTSAIRALSSLADSPLITCAPGTKMQAKDWGVENWQALLRRLSNAAPGHSLVLLGSPQEEAMAEVIAGAWTGKKLNLCGLTPREMAAVIARADLFLGPDSGPMHVAAAAGVPVAIPFSARAKPGIWFPIGRGHQVIYRRTDCFGCNLEVCSERKKECLASIGVDEMFEASMRALDLPAKQRLSPFIGRAI